MGSYLPVVEKRRMLKDSWRVHRMLGTKGAVEMAIAAIYPGTAVEEWFQYGGEPYHFKLTIDFTGEPDDPDRRERVMRRLDRHCRGQGGICAVCGVVQRIPAAGVAAGLRVPGCGPGGTVRVGHQRHGAAGVADGLLHGGPRRAGRGVLGHFYHDTTAL